MESHDGMAAAGAESLMRIEKTWLRWLKLGIAASVAVLILGTVVFRQTLYEASINPRVPFQAQPPVAAPDYMTPAAWAALPDRADGSDLRPGLAAGTDRTFSKVDVFFIHPTTYDRADSWNAPIDSPEAADAVDSYVLPYQASVFNRAGDIWVPRYRQATHYAFLSKNRDSREALALAYRDIEAGFTQFLERRAPGRGLIVAGMGQGALHAFRLLDSRIDGTSLTGDLVAAYLLGTPLPESLAAERLTSLPSCREPHQTACFVAFSAFENQQSAIRHRESAWVWAGPALTPTATFALACHNPLRFMGTGALPSRTAGAGNPAQWPAGQGSLPYSARSQSLPQLMSGRVRAACRDGALLVQAGHQDLTRTPLPLHRGRLDEIRLFYLELQTDSARRAMAWARRQGSLPLETGAETETGPVPSRP